MKTRKEKPKVTKEMTFSQIMEINPDMKEVLFEYGLGCAGCAFSSMDTLENGARLHGIDPKELLEDLNS